MEQYSNELIEQLIQDWQETYNIFSKNIMNGVIIYGAGYIGTKAANYLKSINIEVKYFIDRDSSKWGTQINGSEVIGPEDVRIAEYPFILIAAHRAIVHVMELYKETDYVTMPLEAYYCMANINEYKDVRDHYLEDEKSKNIYNALLYTMFSGTTDSCRKVMEKDMYFSIPEFSGNYDEIFVDVGAFTGDTVESFIWECIGAFKHIYAFEPGEKQYKALTKRMERLYEEWNIDPECVSLVKAGLSDKSGKMSCINTDDYICRHTLGKAEGINVVDTYTLDEFLDGKEVNFIKVDIEGMEMEFLAGAQNTIKRYAPKMALCAYHNPCDLYCIAQYVRKLNPEYKFKLRLHAPLLTDYVLYCYV